MDNVQITHPAHCTFLFIDKSHGTKKEKLTMTICWILAITVGIFQKVNNVITFLYSPWLYKLSESAFNITCCMVQTQCYTSALYPNKGRVVVFYHFWNILLFHFWIDTRTLIIPVVEPRQIDSVGRYSENTLNSRKIFLMDRFDNLYIILSSHHDNKGEPW